MSKWIKKKLADVAKVSGGKRIPKGHSLTDVPNSHPYISVTSMRAGKINTCDLGFVPDVVVDSIKRYRVKQGDIIVSVAGTLGLISKIPLDLDGANLTENADRISEIKIDGEYLFQLLSSNIFQNYVAAQATLNAQPKLSLDNLRSFSFDCPMDIEEQKKIAQILSTWDEAIDAVQELIDKKRRLKKALLSSTFSKYLLSEEASSTVLDLLGNEGYISDGDWIESKDQDENGRVRLIQLADIGEGKFLNKSDRYMTQEKADYLNCTFISGGEILVARMPDPLGRACIFPNMSGVYVTVVDVCIIKPSPKIDPRWIVYLINSPRFRNEIEKRSSGTTRIRISRKNLQKISFFLPSEEQRKKDVSVLSGLDEELALLAQKKALLSKQKKGLMQQLLTGKINIK